MVSLPLINTCAMGLAGKSSTDSLYGLYSFFHTDKMLPAWSVHIAEPR